MSTFILCSERLEQAHAMIRALFAAGCTGTTFRVIQATAHTEATRSADEWTYDEQIIQREGSFADVDPVYHNALIERRGSFADTDPIYHNPPIERQGRIATAAPIYRSTPSALRGSFATVQPRMRLAERLMRAGMTAYDAACAVERVRRGATLVVICAPPDEASRVEAQIMPRITPAPARGEPVALPMAGRPVMMSEDSVDPEREETRLA